MGARAVWLWGGLLLACQEQPALEPLPLSGGERTIVLALLSPDQVRVLALQADGSGRLVPITAGDAGLVLALSYPLTPDELGMVPGELQVFTGEQGSGQPLPMGWQAAATLDHGNGSWRPSLADELARLSSFRVALKTPICRCRRPTALFATECVPCVEPVLPSPPEPPLPPEPPRFLPCPTAWTELRRPAGEAYCEPPARRVCPNGQFQALSDTECGALGPVCPSGALRVVQGPALYVDPTAPAGGDGSLGQPLNNMETAFRRAGSGTTVSLAKGVYSSTTALPVGVKLEGACSSETIIFRGEPLRIQAGDEASVSALTLTGSGVLVDPGARVVLSGLILDDVEEGVHTAGAVVLRDVLIRSAHAYAIWAEFAAEVSAERLVIEHSRGSLQLILGARFAASELWAGFDRSDGILVNSATLTLERAQIVEPDNGLWLLDGAYARARDLVVDGAKEHGIYALGASLAVDRPTLVLERTLVRDSFLINVWAHESTADIHDLISIGARWHGLQCSSTFDPARVERALLDGNGEWCANFYGEREATADVSDVICRGPVVPLREGLIFYTFTQGFARLRRASVVGTTLDGVVITRPMEVEDLRIQSVDLSRGPAFGIDLRADSEVSLSRVLIQDLIGTGIGNSSSTDPEQPCGVEPHSFSDLDLLQVSVAMELDCAPTRLTRVRIRESDRALALGMVRHTGDVIGEDILISTARSAAFGTTGVRVRDVSLELSRTLIEGYSQGLILDLEGRVQGDALITHNDLGVAIDKAYRFGADLGGLLLIENVSELELSVLR